MPNVLTLTTESPDSLLNAGAYAAGAVIRVQSSATEAGAYADLTGTGSTPTIPIITATRSYTGYDPNGGVSTWYRSRFENVGATRLSDWTPAFQVGDETAGLLCSVYDVAQRVTTSGVLGPNDTETILDLIREVSSEIEDYLGAWMAPRPTDPASTMTLTFDVERLSRSVALVRGNVYVGIRSVTAVATAIQDQPDTGGTYTAVTAADVLIRPHPTTETPGIRLLLTGTSGSLFYAGANTLQVTGSFGPAAVPYWLQGIAIAAVIRRWLGKETASPAIALGPDGGVRLLADISPGMHATLERHRYQPVG